MEYFSLGEFRRLFTNEVSCSVVCQRHCGLFNEQVKDGLDKISEKIERRFNLQQLTAYCPGVLSISQD